MPYGLFDYIPDSTIHTMGESPVYPITPRRPAPPQSGTGVGDIGSCPPSIVENGVRYTFNPPQTITRGKCEYVLGASTVIAPPPNRCPAGQNYFEGVKGIYGSVPAGCYTPEEYETRKNTINGVFPYGRRPDNCMIRLADGTCMPELPRAR